jgi:hypothetical protein
MLTRRVWWRVGVWWRCPPLRDLGRPTGPNRVLVESRTVREGWARDRCVTRRCNRGTRRQHPIRCRSGHGSGLSVEQGSRREHGWSRQLEGLEERRRRWRRRGRGRRRCSLRELPGHRRSLGRNRRRRVGRRQRHACPRGQTLAARLTAGLAPEYQPGGAERANRKCRPLTQRHRPPLMGRTEMSDARLPTV